LKSWAGKLGMTEAVELLDATLQEEKSTDIKLSELAESEINIEAADEGDGEEEKPRARKAGGRR
jgi:ferritin-like metal-binding protein YciE